MTSNSRVALLYDNFHVSAFTRRRVILGFATAMTVAGVMLASLQLTQATAGGNEPENENTAAQSDTNDNKQVEAAESVQHSVRERESSCFRPARTHD